MNNKGFTLIELLGVIVVLTLIMLVAIPNITSTFERNKHKIDEKKKEVIISAAEIYANMYLKEDGNYTDFLTGNCGIPIQNIIDEGLLTEDEVKNSNGGDLFDKTLDKIIVVYDEENIEYVIDENGGTSLCEEN